MYAVIKTGGKQHKVKPGDVLEVELIKGADSGQVSFTPLLVVDDDGKAHVGKDLGKAQVTAKVLGEQKGEKINMFKYRPKTGYSRRQGHRQMYTLIEVVDVSMEEAKARSSAKRATKKKTEEPEPAAATSKNTTAEQETAGAVTTDGPEEAGT